MFDQALGGLAIALVPEIRMSMFGQGKRWMHAVFRREAAERAMRREMATHIEQAAERFVARGMSERDALYAARREFGAVAVLQEQARDNRGGQWVNEITTDMKYALRYFARTPLTSLTIVFTLLIGIGLNAAAYSVGQGYLFNPPPGVPSNSSLVEIRATERVQGFLDRRLLSYPELQDYASQPVFAAVAGWASSNVLFDFRDGGEGVVAGVGTYVTSNYFSVLGLQLAAGRSFSSPSTDGTEAELSTILTYAFATSQFGTAANAIGKHIRINDVVITIIGVAPRRFLGADPYTGPRMLFLPMSSLLVLDNRGNGTFTSHDSLLFRAVAKIQPSIDERRVRAVVGNIAARNFAMRRPNNSVVAGATTVARLAGFDEKRVSVGQNVRMVLMFAALDVVILLVCITTVGSLLVGAAVARRREISVRLTLGASRWRIVRQLITETGILALLGGAGGLVLYSLLLRASPFAWMPIDVTPTWHAALFTMLLAVTVAMLCGLSPALHATQQHLADALKESSIAATSRTRLQRMFVIAQVACAQPLLVVLGVTMASLYRDVNQQTVTTLAANLIVAQFDTYSGRGGTQSQAAMATIARRLSGTAGVSGVIARPNRTLGYNVRPVEQLAAKSLGLRVVPVSFEYLNLLGIKVVAGRTFVAADSISRVRPLIVRADFAQSVLGTGTLVGRRFCADTCKDKADTVEIIGVVPSNSAGFHGSDQEMQAFELGDVSKSSDLLVRVSGNAAAVIPMIRSIAHAEAPQVPILSVETIAGMNTRQRNKLTQVSNIMAGAGMLTLLLACIGLYAVVALAVGQRRREIGIRVALGAQTSEVVTLFFKGGLRLSVIGLVTGLPLSTAVIRVIVLQVNEPTENIAAIVAGIAVIVLTVASVATWLPARKAAIVDPLAALRVE